MDCDTGKVFGRFEVLEYSGHAKNKRNDRWVRVRCVCGNVFGVKLRVLRNHPEKVHCFDCDHRSPVPESGKLDRSQ